MLVIETEYGNFGHPRNLLQYIKETGVAEVHVREKYCFEDVFEKNMSADDVSRWAATFVRPVAGTLEEAIRWLRLGGA